MIAVIYGSTTGNTLDTAAKLPALLDGFDVDLFDVKDVGLSVIENYEVLIFAIPTWDYGQVQEDWEEIWDEVDDYDFTGKQVAYIGLGDQLGYAEWFVDAMGMLHDKVVACGGLTIGHWSIEGYEFDESKALTADGQHFVGLALDDDTQSELSDERLEKWCEQLKAELLPQQSLSA